MAENENSMTEIELDTVNANSNTESDEYDSEHDEEKETLMDNVLNIASSKFDWVESKQYWYTLANILIFVTGVTVMILLGLSAPGLWKLFNHDTVCEDRAESNHYEIPSNPFTFYDVLNLSPNYPKIHWITTDSGRSKKFKEKFKTNHKS